MTTGTGGTDVKRMMAMTASPGAGAQGWGGGGCHCHCHCHYPSHEDLARPQAAPFGIAAGGVDASIDALRERLPYVRKLTKAAKELLAIAHEGLREGAAVPADVSDVRAVEAWLQRLNREEDHLEIEIRGFEEQERGKKKGPKKEG